jgi:hypothetical protein
MCANPQLIVGSMGWNVHILVLAEENDQSGIPF